MSDETHRKPINGKGEFILTAGIAWGIFLGLAMGFLIWSCP